MNHDILLPNKDRIKEKMDSFAAFGRTENNGITRLALSKEDQYARDYFCDYCKKLGLTVEIDDMGNIYATLAGEENKPPIVMGSHLDSVKQGGKYDGTLGVIAGLEVVETFVKNNITPRIPLTIVNFTNEEGARFSPSMMSSGVLSGKFSKEDMLNTKDKDGITFKEALDSINYAGPIENRLEKATAFLELHIEQGPTLDYNSVSIGVVECVIGQVCYEVEVRGSSNHAGTTPMTMRNDALFLANDIIMTLRKELGNIDSHLVYTIGKMDVHPNIHTVIPDKVTFTVEARHQNEEILKIVEANILNLPKSSTSNSTKIHVRKHSDRNTVWFDRQFRNFIEQSANELNYSNQRIVSGAGHDAQFIAEFIPTAMIFVPSLDGKSHTEVEYTSLDDCHKGINVLLQTILKLMEAV